MADIANGHRGDVAITLGGKEYVLRPTYTAMQQIERTIGGGLVPLVRRVSEMEHGYTDVTAIITAGLNAAGEPATLDAVGKLVFAEGLLNLQTPVLEFLGNALSGDKKDDDDAGEVKAAGRKKSRTEDSPPSPTQT